MQYGIYTIKNEREIPLILRENPYTLYVKIDSRDIKDYYYDYIDIMQNALQFHTKDCVGNRDAYLDWMCGLDWGIYIDDSEDSKMYENVILVFEHWSKIGNWLNSAIKYAKKYWMIF